MKIKTGDLAGPALDWAVWKCAGGADAYSKTAGGTPFLKLWKGNSAKYLHPSTDWSQGGPIIERERPMLCCDTYGEGEWQSTILRGPYAWSAYGPTPLIAAMRCYVASKLGDEVDVPGSCCEGHARNESPADGRDPQRHDRGALGREA